jgi:HEAT repeat protein
MVNLKQLPGHIKALDNGDVASKREAMRTLKLHESQEWAEAPAQALRPLVESLQRQLRPTRLNGDASAPPSFRQEAATILGKIGPASEAAVPELAALLANGVSDPVREAAATALGNIGKAARPAIGELLHVIAPGCRVTLAASVARALGEIGSADQRVRNALLQLWAAPITHDHSRLLVTIALCKLDIEAPGLIETLTGTWIGHAKTGARQAATEALSWCNKDTVGVVPALITALYDEDEPIRQKAALGLQRLRLSPARAVQICCQQLQVCPLAQTALRKSGALAVPPLIAALRDKDATMRHNAAKTLGAIGEVAAPAAPALAAALKDKDRSVRLDSAKALWNITKQADAVVPVLVSLLNGKGTSSTDTGEERRTFLQTVIEALCRIGPLAKNAVPTLSALVKDTNRSVSESARRALQAIHA